MCLGQFLVDLCCARLPPVRHGSVVWSPEDQRIPDLITDLQRFIPFAGLQGNRLPGEHLHLPAAGKKKRKTRLSSRYCIYQCRIETGKKSLVNNKSWMNVFFMVAIYEHELLQELQIKTVIQSVWFRAFAKSQKETSASPPAPRCKNSTSRRVRKLCGTKITSMPKTLPFWEQRYSKSIWVGTLTHVYNKRLCHFQSVRVIISAVAVAKHSHRSAARCSS